MRNTKGITLIALIITIIVMLILVAVTVSVALNGGIFNNVKGAKEKTQREVDKEQLISAVAATVDSKGDFHLDQIEAPEGLRKISNGIYENEKTGKQYKINEVTGTVKEYDSSDSTTIIGIYYEPYRWGNLNWAIEITDTKWIEGEEEFNYTIEGDRITVIFDEEDDDTYTYIINSDGILFDEDNEMVYVRSNATNISTTLLDGMIFETDDRVASFANGNLTHTNIYETLTYTYVVYNGKVYSYEIVAEINYSGDEIVSLTSYEEDDNHELVEVTYTKQ